MPVAMHHTTEGWYYQWGEHGKNYFSTPMILSRKTRQNRRQVCRDVQPIPTATGGNEVLNFGKGRNQSMADTEAFTIALPEMNRSAMQSGSIGHFYLWFSLR
jgi:hypothetical protein